MHYGDDLDNIEDDNDTEREKDHEGEEGSAFESDVYGWDMKSVEDGKAQIRKIMEKALNDSYEDIKQRQRATSEAHGLIPTLPKPKQNKN